jgi:uncharacterized protein YrrD
VSGPTGEPISYLTLEEGTKVLSTDGEEIGKVAHVLADLQNDIFEGIVIDTSSLPGGHVFADATLVDEIRIDGVILSIDAEAATSLPAPSANPAAMRVGPDELVKEGTAEDLRDKLRRAWDVISGK